MSDSYTAALSVTELIELLGEALVTYGDLFVYMEVDEVRGDIEPALRLDVMISDTGRGRTPMFVVLR